MGTTKISLKLLVNTTTHKVLFAEAGKDFVDFLFNLLSLPLGTIIKLLKKHIMVGCLGNLYASIEDLSENFLQPSQVKESILNPRAPLNAIVAPLLICDDDDAGKVYMCPSYHLNVATNTRMTCPHCNHKMTKGVPFVRPVASSTEQVACDDTGFVKGVVTYMVMDDLEVKPMSTISGITMLNKFNVQEVGALEERVVELDMAGGLKLLKASLQSRTVLTTVFLGNKAV